MRPGTSRFMATVATMWKANRTTARFNWSSGNVLDTTNDIRLLRMLDLGGHSSTWLAWNQILDKYVAVKVLDGRSTNLHERRLLWEEEALKRLTFPSTTVHPKDINYFAHR
ncbi:hypothetical protein EYR38_002955 [Pleurotus pulmonarius]|nr:hypothetical protein EYR38_002955 [Pleurotus pulmonarius]